MAKGIIYIHYRSCFNGSAIADTGINIDKQSNSVVYPCFIIPFSHNIIGGSIPNVGLSVKIPVANQKSNSSYVVSKISVVKSI